MRKPAVARYVGGPLDGSEWRKTGRGRWPSYRAEDGQQLPTTTGDRARRNGRPLYVYREDVDVSTVPVRVMPMYVHTSVLDQWDAARRPKE